MRKAVLGAVAVAALTATLGAGVAKAAWDKNVTNQSVNVVIGTPVEIKNAKLTGGDLTKSLIPEGAIKGTNDVYEIDLGTLTYEQSETVKRVGLEYNVYLDGEDQPTYTSDNDCFNMLYFDGDSKDSGTFQMQGDSYTIESWNNTHFYLRIYPNSSTITDDMINKIKGKTITLELVLNAYNN